MNWPRRSQLENSRRKEIVFEQTQRHLECTFISNNSSVNYSLPFSWSCREVALWLGTPCSHRQAVVYMSGCRASWVAPPTRTRKCGTTFFSAPEREGQICNSHCNKLSAQFLRFGTVGTVIWYSSQAVVYMSKCRASWVARCTPDLSMEVWYQKFHNHYHCWHSFFGIMSYWDDPRGGTQVCDCNNRAGSYF